MGEHIAVRYLQRKGFTIIERNYTKKWGEIDIIARKGRILNFVEVKSKTGSPTMSQNSFGGEYRPEDGMHRWKIERLKRTILSYLAESRFAGEWQFDLVTIYLDPATRTAKVRFMENLIL